MWKLPFIVLIVSSLTLKSQSSSYKTYPGHLSNRVLKIYDKDPMAFGTGFIYTKNKTHFLITARHLIKPERESGEIIFIYFFQNDEWKLQGGNVYFSINPDVDIAVIRLDLDIELEELFNSTPNLLLPLGSDVFFFGFPHGLSSIDLEGSRNGFPMPLLKKATLSGQMNVNTSTVFILDGINNPGFSGGPVFTQEYIKSDSVTGWQIIGVITGYLRYEDENSGLIVAHDFENVDQIIEIYSLGLQ